jgi:ubiquinone/menaquinone biosynthesis C-methylase UbiE
MANEMTSKRESDGLRVLQMANGAWVAQAIYVVAKIGIADLLAKGPRSASDLAAETQVNADALYRTLRALAGLSIFREQEGQTFALTPLAEPLRTDHPDSVRAFAIMTNEELYEAFGDFLYTLRTGKPGFDKRFGMPVFAYYDTHPEVAATFHRGMNDWHRWNTVAICESFDFTNVRKVCDVGGGNGLFLSTLLQRYPNLSGILVDRASGIEAARAGQGGPLPRCEVVVANFLEELPAGADLYTIKYVINDWADEDAVRILTSCRKAMAKDGRVLVLESLIEPGNDPAFTKWLDLLMMAVTGGRERSASDFARLFEKAGLRLNRVLPTRDTISVVEAVAV